MRQKTFYKKWLKVKIYIFPIPIILTFSLLCSPCFLQSPQSRPLVQQFWPRPCTSPTPGASGYKLSSLFSACPPRRASAWAPCARTPLDASASSRAQSALTAGVRETRNWMNDNHKNSVKQYLPCSPAVVRSWSGCWHIAPGRCPEQCNIWTGTGDNSLPEVEDDLFELTWWGF